MTDDEGHAFAMWTRTLSLPEQHVVLRTNAPPRMPEPNVLQPDDRVLLRLERNPIVPGSVGLRYQLVDPGRVDVFIWSAQGRLVRRWRLGDIPAGEHRLEWDGRTAHGRAVANGVYHWELRVAAADGSESVQTKSIVLR